MPTAIVLVLTAALVLQPPLAAAQAVLTAEAQVAAFRQLAGAIPPGTRVNLRTREGRRLSATLLAVESDRLVVQRNARVPEPAMAIAFTDLTKLERAPSGGFSAAKALTIGLAAGVGAILTLFAIAVAVGD